MWGRAIAAILTAGCIDVVVLRGEYRGFVAGVLAASAVWLVALRVRASVYRRAVEGEQQTRDLVDGVPQWLAVHDLPLHDRAVDHVVVTPLAVLAVETTWWGEASPSVHEGRRETAIDRARLNARSLKHLLRSRAFDLPVWPVVVAWGPGAEATELGPIDVVAGEDPGLWIAAHQVGAIHSRLAADVHAALVEHQGTYNGHLRAAAA